MSQPIIHIKLQLESPLMRRLRSLEKALNSLTDTVNLTEFPMVRLDSVGPKVSAHSEHSYVRLLDQVNVEVRPEKRFDALVSFGPEFIEIARAWCSEIKYVSAAKGTFELLRDEFKQLAAKLRRFEKAMGSVSPLQRAVHAHFVAAVRAGPDRLLSETFVEQNAGATLVYPDEFYTPLSEARDQCFERGELEDYKNYIVVFEELFSTELARFVAYALQVGYRASVHESHADELKRLTDELDTGIILASAGLLPV